MVKSLDLKSTPRLKKTPRLKPSYSPSPPRRIPTRQKVIGASIGAMVLAIALIAFLILPEARIKITVRTEPKTADFEIRVDKNQEKVDGSSLIAPGKILEQELAGSKTYPATGKKNIGKKASGFVKIYNFSKTTLILKAETTLLTTRGQQYFFTQDAGGIRPTALIGLEEQEVDESSLIPPVPLVASGPGEAYNLPKGTRLEIENEVFGKQPKVLYAVAAEDISGGTTEEIKVVTAGDLVVAEEALVKDLVRTAREALAATSTSLKLLDNAVVTEISESKSSVSANTEIGEFEIAAKIKLRGLAYNEIEILSIITERIKRLLPENKILEADYKPRLQSNFINLNLEQGSGTLNTHFEGRVIYRVREIELLEKARGKTPEEIKEILLSRPEIEKVEIKLYPFWVKKVPKFSEKVRLEIQ